MTLSEEAIICRKLWHEFIEGQKTGDEIRKEMAEIFGQQQKLPMEAGRL